jgi:hypothetical protein
MADGHQAMAEMLASMPPGACAGRRQMARDEEPGHGEDKIWGLEQQLRDVTAQRNALIQHRDDTIEQQETIIAAQAKIIAGHQALQTGDADRRAAGTRKLQVTHFTPERPPPVQSTPAARRLAEGAGGRATTTLYMIGDGQCGENDVDSRAVRFAKLFQPGLIEGNCVENGYTIPAGTNDVDTPLGKSTTRLFTEAGAWMSARLPLLCLFRSPAAPF